MSEDSKPKTIGAFLDKHYKKFAIVGIFGSVSVFVNKVSVFTEESQRLALFGSLLIFLLVATVIATHSLTQIVNNRQEKETASSVGFVVILIGIVFLMYAVGSTVLSYSSIFWLVGSVILASFIIFEWEKKYPSAYYQRYDDEAIAQSALFASTILFLSEHRWLVEKLFGTYYPIAETLLVVLLWTGMTFLVGEIIVGLAQFEREYDRFGKFGLVPGSNSKLIVSSVFLFFVPVIALNPATETASSAYQGIVPYAETWAQQFYIRWIVFVAGTCLVVRKRVRKTPNQTYWLAVALFIATLIISLYDIGLLLYR